MIENTFLEMLVLTFLLLIIYYYKFSKYKHIILRIEE